MGTAGRRLAAVALTTVCVGPLAVFAVARGCAALDGASIDEGETVAVWIETGNGQHGGHWSAGYRVDEVLPGGGFRVTREGVETLTVRADQVEAINRWSGE